MMGEGGREKEEAEREGMVMREEAVEKEKKGVGQGRRKVEV